MISIQLIAAFSARKSQICKYLNDYSLIILKTFLSDYSFNYEFKYYLKYNVIRGSLGI